MGKEKEEEEARKEKTGPSTTEALKITGALLWLTTRTRVDMTLVSHKSAKNALNLPAFAVHVATRGLRYLKGSIDYGLVYEPAADHNRQGPADAKEPETLDTYTDASHMMDWEKSQLGVVCFLNGSPISWRTTTST